MAAASLRFRTESTGCLPLRAEFERAPSDVPLSLNPADPLAPRRDSPHDRTARCLYSIRQLPNVSTGISTA
jgi:hypothetical protein